MLSYLKVFVLVPRQLMQKIQQAEQQEKKGLLNICLAFRKRKNIIQRLNAGFHLMCILFKEAVVRGQTGNYEVQALVPLVLRPWAN